MRTYSILGATAHPVTVVAQAGERKGIALPGLPPEQWGTAGEHVRAALKLINEYAPQRITVALNPTDLPKWGCSFDLPIVLACATVFGRLPALPCAAAVGELSASGEVRPVRGVLPAAMAAYAEGMTHILVPRANALEAALVEGITVVPVSTVEDAIAFMRTGRIYPLPAAPPEPPCPGPQVDDIKGQDAVKAAITNAIEHGRSLLLIGPAGVGTTMLAARANSLRPPLTPQEALAVRCVASAAGFPQDAAKRPFRAPHYSVSTAALIGTSRHLGELSLADHGVLFTDEAPRFGRAQVKRIQNVHARQEVVVVNAGRYDCRPARFVWLGAASSCPCGHNGSRRRCTCTIIQLRRHYAAIESLPFDDVVVME